MPAQKVLGVDHRIGRRVENQLVAIGKGRAAAVLVFFVVPVPQRLAKIFLMQAAYLTLIVQLAVISVSVMSFGILVRPGVAL